MRRAVLLAAVLLAWGAPAHAARAWTDLQPLATPAPSMQSVVAAGGQTLYGWQTFVGGSTTLTVRLGDHPAQTIGDVSGGFGLAASPSGAAEVAWGVAVGDEQHVMAASIAADGALGTPADLGVGSPSQLTMNAAGDATIVIARYTGSIVIDDFRRVPAPLPATLTAFKPADGKWGAPVELPSNVISGMVLAGDGTAIFPTYSETGTQAVTRTGDGPLTDPVSVLPDVFTTTFAADGQGHALAVGTGNTDRMLTYARYADGVWQAPVKVPLATALAGGPAAAVDGAGDAVIAWRDSDTSRYPYGEGAVRVMTGSLTTGTFAAPVAVDTDALAPSGTPSVATATDGSAVIVYSDAPHQAMRVVRRDGLGAFAAPQIAACVGTYSYYAPNGLTIDDSGRATVLIPQGEAHDAPATTPQDKTCHVPETGATGPRPAFTPSRVIAGEPVHIDDSGIRRPDWDIRSCGWDMDADGVQETQTPGPALDWTFAGPGRHTFLVQCSQTSRGGDGTLTPYDTFVVDALARPTLAVPTRLGRREVLRHGVPVEANAFTGADAVSVSLTLRAHGAALGRLRRALGATPTTLRVQLNRRGRAAARRGVVARMVLRQGGKVLGLQRVQIR